MLWRRRVTVWTVAEAKAKFSEVVERAVTDGPQTVTRNGRTTTVIVVAAEWERKTKSLRNDEIPSLEKN